MNFAYMVSLTSPYGLRAHSHLSYETVDSNLIQAKEIRLSVWNIQLWSNIFIEGYSDCTAQ